MPGPIGGVYAVISELAESKEIYIGKSKSYFFTKGFYTYVGSALNGLEKRLERHLGNRKNMHWHIDYLLESATVREILSAATNENLECSIARSLSAKLPAISGFGCSDCHCHSHLFYNPYMQNILSELMISFKRYNLRARKRIGN